jgi:hypothetical protein
MHWGIVFHENELMRKVFFLKEWVLAPPEWFWRGSMKKIVQGFSLQR